MAFYTRTTMTKKEKAKELIADSNEIAKMISGFIKSLQSKN